MSNLKNKNNRSQSKTLKSLFSLFVIFLVLGCSADNNNILSPGKLAGSYTLQSFTDKITNNTFEADHPKQITVDGEPIMVTITGSLELTESRFAFNFVQILVTTSAPQRFVVQDTGTYTIQGFNMMQVYDNGGESTITCRIIDGKLILETPDVQFVFV